MRLGGPALLVAAAGVGFGHAVLPDHWVPLAVMGRTRRYRLARVGRLSLLAAITHVLVSVILGAIIVVIGLQFRHLVQSAEDLIVGLILVATGLGFIALELTGHGHRHDHDHDHGHDDHARGAGHTHSHRRNLASVVVPFGAAASPDLTILPVFLAATASGIGVAIGSVAIFAGVTITTIVGLTLAATRGGYEIKGDWLERWGNAFTAAVLIIIGALIASGIL
jgi:nickel/cobalt exporter